MSMGISSDTIGNQSRDLPTCIAVPQPTALSHTVTVMLKLSGDMNGTFNASNIKSF
jgi:hypothetical protein